MKKIFQTTLIIGFSQIFVVAVQVVRAKIIAVLIGPAGVGVLGNIYVFLTLVENFCFLGIHFALLKYASKTVADNDFNKTGKIFSTVIFTHLATAFFGVVIAWVFIAKIGGGMYQDVALLPFLFFAVLAIPFMILQADFGNFFNAFSDVKLIAKINIFPAILTFCSAIPLILIFGVRGAIVSIFFEAFLLFLVTLYFYRRHYSGKVKIGKSLFSRELAVKMLKYGGVFQTTVLINAFAVYLIRIMVTAKLLLSGAGIFYSALSIGSYLMMLQAPLGVYLYPKISSIHKDKRKTEKEINEMMRFSLIILVPAGVCIILISDIVIKLLLSGAFLAVGPLLVWIIAARFFEILQSLVGLPIFIMEKFKICLKITVAFNIVLAAISYVFMEKFNLLGVAVAQSVSYALLFAMYLAAARKTFGFKLDRINVYYVISGLCLFAISGYFKEYSLIWRLIPLSAVLIWLVFGVKRREWAFLFNYAKQCVFFAKKEADKL